MISKISCLLSCALVFCSLSIIPVEVKGTVSVCYGLPTEKERKGEWRRRSDLSVHSFR